MQSAAHSFYWRSVVDRGVRGGGGSIIFFSKLAFLYVTEVN